MGLLKPSTGALRLTLLAAVAAVLMAAAPAGAQAPNKKLPQGSSGNTSDPNSPVKGAAFTTINPSHDGAGTCKNGNGLVNCNLYGAPQYVWINGGPDKNQLATPGRYFFAVLEPGGQNQNPNDGVPVDKTDKNLSDDYDAYTNRTFTIANGEISSYSGTHVYDVDQQDNDENKIRLFPYSTTRNNGGVYVLAICYLGNGYPVSPRDCKYDTFKIPDPDAAPPECPSPVFTIENGEKVVRQSFKDPGGLDGIEVYFNENINFSFWPTFTRGTTNPVTIVGTAAPGTQTQQLQVLVWDVSGNWRVCDPVLTTLRKRAQTFRGLSRAEHRVTIKNARRGFSAVVVRVNGRRFMVSVRPGQTRTIDVRSAMRAKRNRISLQGIGGAGASATVLIAN